MTKIKINSSIEYVFVLGAGASIDYGLPSWDQLGTLISNKLQADVEGKYKNNKAILNWIDKIGEGKAYKTIDECVKLEAVSEDFEDNGHEIENEIFLIMNEVFNELYKDNKQGWIGKLNEKIRSESSLSLESKIVFINYNYDDVLDRNLLNFSYLKAKQRIWLYRERLQTLLRCVIQVFYPHGHFDSNVDSQLRKQKKTFKSDLENYVDVISCYESEQYSIEKEYGKKPVSLYILGLGGGLEINLQNLYFPDGISDIRITIRDQKRKNKILKFLSDKFEINEDRIVVYQNCTALIDDCFNFSDF